MLKTRENCVVRTIHIDDYIPLATRMRKLRQVSSTLVEWGEADESTYTVYYFSNGSPTMVPEESKAEIERAFDDYFALRVVQP